MNHRDGGIIVCGVFIETVAEVNNDPLERNEADDARIATMCGVSRRATRVSSSRERHDLRASCTPRRAEDSAARLSVRALPLLSTDGIPAEMPW
jgi:hypothetical protein